MASHSPGAPVRTRAEHRQRGVLGRAALGLGLGLALVVTGLVVTAGPPSPAGPPAELSAAVTLPPFAVEPAVRMARTPSRASPYAGVPRRLAAPRLGVDAPVVPIGVVGGVLLPPGDPRVLGWWAAGARAGAARGSTVITGHTVHTGGGVFDDLAHLRRGDVLRVRTPRGEVSYAVSAVAVYRRAALARDAARLFDQTLPGRLVLVTCSDWDGAGYLTNTVVLADRAAGPT